MEEWIKYCDECGKMEDRKTINFEESSKRCDTRLGWYRLEEIAVIHRTKNNGKEVPSKHVLRVSKYDDPDFCSKGCLIEWISKRIDKI